MPRSFGVAREKKFVYMNNMKASETKSLEEKRLFCQHWSEELERRNLAMQEQCNKMKELLEENNFIILSEVITKIQETECEEMELAKIPMCHSINAVISYSPDRSVSKSDPGLNPNHS